MISRFRKSSVYRRRLIDSFESDKSRIIFSSSFRRLQQKAQVFSLESNASVRTRMTHTLEVADLGRKLATNIAYKLTNMKLLSEGMIPSFVSIIENGCLIHDIGNPPFGHFGEYAISDWARNLLTDIKKNFFFTEEFLLKFRDFEYFDGNPQGFRIITKLHNEVDGNSLNLTYSTLFTSIKYPRSTSEIELTKTNKTLKKGGYFESESETASFLRDRFDLKPYVRFPLTYIVEAADDIAYCMSDIADGIEKRIISLEDFVNAFNEVWLRNYGNKSPLYRKKITLYSKDVSIYFSNILIKHATNNFINQVDRILDGSAEPLISSGDGYKILESLKEVARTKLYSSPEAQNIELSGYKIITGILDNLKCLLNMKSSEFIDLISLRKTDGFDKEKRLITLLGDRYKKRYLEDIERYRTENFESNEMWLRIHLLVDHVSGMTDQFALQTYQMLLGIKIFNS